MRKVILLVAVLLVCGFQPTQAQSPMKFFVTSAPGPDATGPRGIRGADQHCEVLGYTAGYGEFQWRAFLDAPAAEGQAAVKAIDRIGDGPWHNVEGVLIAESPQDLAGEGHNVGRHTAFDEKGFATYARDDSPSPADLLGSPAPDPNGRYFCFAL